MTRGRLYLVGWLVVLAAVAFNTYQGLSNASSLSAQTTRTCEVQQRSLVAQPYLTLVMRDIAGLLAPRPGAARPPKPVARILDDLRNQLAAYVDIESKQPKNRICS